MFNYETKIDDDCAGVILEDVTTLYDDRKAMLRTLDALPKATSKKTRRELNDALIRNEERLRIALMILPKEERHDIMYELDTEDSGPYEAGAWDYMEGLL